MQAPSATLRPLNQPRSVSSRAISIGLAVVLNVGAIYLLASGLGSEAMKLVIQNIDVAVIEPPPDEAKPPPPPPPAEREPPPFVPPPDINIDVPAEAAPTNAINVTTEQPRPAPAAPAVATPAKGSNQNRVTRNDYPPVSLRLNETGITIVRVSIDASGAVVSAELAKSSGHNRLDERALQIVRTRFRYSPAKDAAGTAIPAVINQAVKWELN